VLEWLPRDLRNTAKPAGVLEPHSDEVVQVKFHPIQRHMLLSGSADGLVCIHDTSLGLLEDDATVAVLNVEQPVSSMGFHGEQGEFLHVFTTVEGLALFDMTTFGQIANLADARPALSTAFQTQVDYLISAHWTQSSGLCLAAGDQQGTVLLGQFDPGCQGSPQAVARLANGHTDVVRTLHWHPEVLQLLKSGI